MHCHAGAHRAGVTGIAILMHLLKIGVADATALAQEARPVIEPVLFLRELLVTLDSVFFARDCDSDREFLLSFDGDFDGGYTNLQSTCSLPSLATVTPPAVSAMNQQNFGQCAERFAVPPLTSSVADVDVHDATVGAPFLPLARMKACRSVTDTPICFSTAPRDTAQPLCKRRRLPI